MIIDELMLKTNIFWITKGGEKEYVILKELLQVSIYKDNNFIFRSVTYQKEISQVPTYKDINFILRIVT